MVKFERKNTDKAIAAELSLQKAKKKNVTYNTPEVNDALYEMFHGKCYICENKSITSCQIEHLKAHKGDVDLKYAWENLFWSCAHCNNTKLAGYEPILDCSKEDVDNVIAFRKVGYFGVEEKLNFEALDEREETLNTVRLLYDVYYGTTTQKKIEAAVIRKNLRDEISKFKGYVREYKEATAEDKKDLESLVKRNLKNNSAFTAFKRWLIKDHKDFFPEFAKYICELSG